MTHFHSFKALVSALGLVVLIMVTPLLGHEARAQDIAPTVEANPITIVTEEAQAPVTVEDGGINVTVNTPPATTETSAEPEPWYFKYLMGFASLLVIVGGVLAVVNKWLETTKQSRMSMTMAEGGYSRLPDFGKAAVAGVLRQFIRLGGNLEEILKEIEDDIPFAMKPSPTPTSGPATPPQAVTPVRPTAEGGAPLGGSTGFPPIGG